MVGFPAPLQLKVAQSHRDTPDEPLFNIMKDGRLEATLTASQTHTHRASKPVTRAVVQRSQTYDIFTESYRAWSR